MAKSSRTRTWPRTLRAWVEAEKQAASQGRQAALKAARDRFYKGDIAREMARFSEENGGLFRYEDFAGYTAKVEEPVSIDYRGYTIYKNASATQGPAELFRAKNARGLRPQEDGTQLRRLHSHLGRGHQACHGRSRHLPGRHGFHPHPVRGSAVGPVRRGARKLIDAAKASLEFSPWGPRAIHARIRAGDPSPRCEPERERRS